jgi:hypothetical protein
MEQPVTVAIIEDQPPVPQPTRPSLGGPGR